MSFLNFKICELEGAAVPGKKELRFERLAKKQEHKYTRTLDVEGFAVYVYFIYNHK